MVVKADLERVKTVLKDTITFLCRNGLTFKSNLCVEALIGVTLDDDDVFLISINELVTSEKAKENDNVPLHYNGDINPVILANGDKSRSIPEPVANQPKNTHEVEESEKQELQQQPQSANMYSDINEPSNSVFGDDQNFTSLSDMCLVPVGLHEEGAVWAQATQMTSPMQQVASRCRGPRTSIVTSGGQGDDQTPGQYGQDTSQVGAIIK